MELKQILKFIDLEDKRLIKKFGKNSSSKEKILARMVKLTEEVGELADEILVLNGDQRKEKLNKQNKNNLADEFADVIITTLLLAKRVDINIEKALSQKIKKINKRYKN